MKGVGSITLEKIRHKNAESRRVSCGARGREEVQVSHEGELRSC